MSIRRVSLVLCICMVLISTGCFQDESSDKEARQPLAEKMLTASDIERFGPDRFSQLLSENRDRVLMINVWATWCIPCREEFPDLEKLARKYKDRGLTLIAVSVDYQDEIESKIIPFLRSQKTSFPVYVNNFERQEDMINTLNEEWSGALPATFIYDRSGKQNAFLPGQHSLEEFEAAVVPLLP